MFTLNTQNWTEKPATPVNTLQIFITNRCNMRCKGCFYAHKLDNHSDMNLDSYKSIVEENSHIIKKIILLGGEPLLYKQIGDMLIENNKHNISTTVYTNGRNIEILKDLPNVPFDVRIGVFGNTLTEKPLSKIKSTDHPVKIVFMIRKDNIEELNNVALEAESRFNCQALYLSSIRDITVTKDYWKDTDETVTNDDYAKIVQKFINEYNGSIKQIDISTRGVLLSNVRDMTEIKHCRFGNIFPDEKKIICPLDISLNKTSNEFSYNKRKCNKHTHCVLQKISLIRN